MFSGCGHAAFNAVKLAGMERTEIKKLVASAGGVTSLARQLGISKSAVSQWDRIPVERVLQVEKLTGVSRYALRPDIFGTGPDA